MKSPPPPDDNVDATLCELVHWLAQDHRSNPVVALEVAKRLDSIMSALIVRLEDALAAARNA